MTEGCVSPIQHMPLKKKKKKKKKKLNCHMFVNTNELELGTRAFFSRSKYVLFSENVSLGLFLVCCYKTWLPSRGSPMSSKSCEQ